MIRDFDAIELVSHGFVLLTERLDLAFQLRLLHHDCLDMLTALQKLLLGVSLLELQLLLDAGDISLQSLNFRI